MTQPRRGRRSNASVPDVSRADNVMAMTAHRLVMWGIPSKAVFESVSRVESERTRAVGPERVKQIYRAWLSRQDPPVWRGRDRYDKASLRRAIPPTAVDVRQGRSASSWVSAMASTLLRNHGEWPPSAGDSIVNAEFSEPAAFRLTPLAARRDAEERSTRPILVFQK